MMEIKTKAYEKLPSQIVKLIEVAVKKPSKVKCVVTSIKNGGSKLVLTIESSVWYSDYTK